MLLFRLSKTKIINLDKAIGAEIYGNQIDVYFDKTSITGYYSSNEEAEIKFNELINVLTNV